MTEEVGELEHLLAVQAADTEADQLRHRRAHAAERQALTELERAADELERTRQALTQRRDELAEAQAALERQVEAGRQRAEHIEQRMRSGQVSAARELTVMDEELRHLRQHTSGLEDRVLAVMEQLEPVDAELAELHAQVADLSRRRLELAAAVAEMERTVDAELAAVETRRAQAATMVPAALLARYEQIRARNGGIGAARLVGSTCSGCHLELPSMEVDRIRKAPAGTVFTCEQCGRILVR